MGIISCFPGGGGGVQPDWNQNDSTQPDYVKNRPFYTSDHVEIVLVEESTVSFAPANGVYTGVLQSAFAPTVGETYKVYWDGAAYECACVNFNDRLVIGNLSIMGAGSDTGEPFLMFVKNGPGIGIGTADTSASHTISISGYAESVVKIDQKYLPVASETEPGIISITPLSNAILQKVKNEYFRKRRTQVSGYGGADTIEEYANKNNSQGIFSSGKFSGAVLACYNNTVNKYITSVLSGGANIECWKFSQGSTTMERLWGIFEDGVVISSSTADSTKKFKITVDDSGSLTITNEQEETSSICATPSDISTAVSDHDSNASAHSEQFDKKQNVPTQLTALPDSGTALTANTLYNVDATVDTYSFTPPVGNSWAHGIFATGTTPNITFTGKIIGKLPTFEASKQYEFDVLDGAWIVQEVVTQ